MGNIVTISLVADCMLRFAHQDQIGFCDESDHAQVNVIVMDGAHINADPLKPLTGRRVGALLTVFEITEKAA